MNKTNTFRLTAVLAILAVVFLISAKKQEPENSVYEYLYIVENSDIWKITSKDTVEYIRKDREYNRTYGWTNKEKEFITKTINKYEREGYELFSFGVHTYNDGREKNYHSILMRRKQTQRE